MMKKITVVGKGTVGCLAVSHFLKWTDYEIEWVHDPKIETSPVGEGTTLLFPETLSRNLNFRSGDLDKINSTPKLGIWKKGWGKGKEFVHTFPAGRVGIHFNAIEFQNYIFSNLVNNSRIQIIEDNLTNYDSIDSDYVMVCTGSPKTLNDDFIEHSNIPVNSAIVFQCPWNNPKFLYSLTFAKKYGWVFGIPLKNRCAIGYLYNNNFCTEEEVKSDVQSILDEFDLTPSIERNLKFFNYSRKQNFSDRVIFNGNASFFLEPLEATSTTTAIFVNQLAIDLWENKKITVDEANIAYLKELDDIESMICLHYFAGSVHKSDFWNYAKSLASKKIYSVLKEENDFSQMIKALYRNELLEGGVGSWSALSYRENILGLGLVDKINEIVMN